MAASLTAGLSFDDVRASVKRVQTEGRKFVNQLRKEATTLVNRRPADVLADVRKRAARAVKELDAQRVRLSTLVVDRITGLADEAVTRTGLAKAQDVSDLKRRVHEIERRLERATKAA